MSKKRKRVGLLWDAVYLKVGCIHRSYTAWRYAKQRLRLLKGGYRGSNEEFQVVIDFWKPYGVKPRKYWYQLYCDGKGAFDPKYIPDTMWDNKIFPYFNNLMWGRAYADKCIYDRLFPYLKQPKTIIKNSCGRFYDCEQNIITKEEAMVLCQKYDSFIVKYTTFSSGGKNIRVYEKGEVNESTIIEMFNYYNINFIVQELVEQHRDLAKIHKLSLNTLRVISFFFKGKVYILSSQLRMGCGDARVDNYSSGGYACNVKPDGYLSDRAVTKTEGWATKHPCGLAFKDIKVPEYDKVVAIIQKEHLKLPQLNIIGWDFAIDKDGDPVFIEMNVFPGQNQNGSGPTFGDLTEEVLKDVFIDKTLKDAFI